MTSHAMQAPGRDLDIREVVTYIANKYPNRKLYAAGFSYGANCLAKMIGIDGKDCKLSGAYCCQPPMVYHETIKNLNKKYWMDFLLGMKLCKMY